MREQWLYCIDIHDSALTIALNPLSVDSSCNGRTNTPLDGSSVMSA